MTSRHHETPLVSGWFIGDVVFTPLKHAVHTYLKSCFEHVEHLVCAPLLIMIARMYLGQPNRCVGVVWGRRSDVDSVWDHGVCSGPTFISFWHCFLAAKAGDTSFQACGRVRRDDDDERGRISKI